MNLFKNKNKKVTLDELQEIIDKPKQRIVWMHLHYNDGTKRSYSQKYNIDETKMTYIDCYFDFYKWFFFRKSQWYTFNYNTGAEIINRDNISKIIFEYEE